MTNILVNESVEIIANKKSFLAWNSVDHIMYSWNRFFDSLDLDSFSQFILKLFYFSYFAFFYQFHCVLPIHQLFLSLFLLFNFFYSQSLMLIGICGGLTMASQASKV